MIRGSGDADDGARRRSSGEFGAHRGAGPGDPRPAPARADRRCEPGEIRREHAELVALIAELRAILGDEARVYALIKEELRERRRPLRRRAAHRRSCRRGRDRPRAADPRRGHGHLDHAHGLRQAARAVGLPPAEARRRRRDGDGHQGRRLDRAPARRLDARLRPVLHDASARSTASRCTSCPRASARRAAARSSTCCRCARARRCARSSRRATSPRASTSSRRRATASSRRRASASTTRRCKPTASSPSTSARATSSIGARLTVGRATTSCSSRAGPGGALRRDRGARRWAAPPAA